jgi:hypothetical protein
MKKLIKSTLVLFAALSIASCSLTVPVAATSNEVGSKVGRASGNCYLGVLCFDADASIMSAAKDGGISKISTVDFKTRNILGLLITYECIVTGE